MKNYTIQKLIYELVSKLFVFPIYKFVFKGHLIGKENIPQKDSFIMVSNVTFNCSLDILYATDARWQRWCNGLWKIKSKNDE